MLGKQPRHSRLTIVGCVKSNVMGYIYILDRCNSRSFVRIFPLMSRAYENVLGVIPKNCYQYLCTHLHMLHKKSPQSNLQQRKTAEDHKTFMAVEEAVMKY